MSASSRPGAPGQADAEHPFFALLIDGPYDGQDIRVSHDELTLGVLIRNQHRYVKAEATRGRGTASSLPLFRWLEEAKVVLLPLLSLPCAL